MQTLTISTFFKTIALVVISTFAINVSADQNRGGDDRDSRHDQSKSYQSNSRNNEELVVQFYDKVFNQRLDVKKLAMQYLTEDYIQHNPYVPTGRQGFIDAIGGYLPLVPDTKWDIKQVITDGDLVVLHIHVHSLSDTGPGTALVDIFRVCRGKIVEHWDVSQQIPTQMAHNNGMF